jgi:hypothetical protein
VVTTISGTSVVTTIFNSPSDSWVFVALTFIFHPSLLMQNSELRDTQDYPLSLEQDNQEDTLRRFFPFLQDSFYHLYRTLKIISIRFFITNKTTAYRYNPGNFYPIMFTHYFSPLA